MTRPDRLVVEGLGRLPQFSHAGLTDDLIFVSGTLGSGDGLVLVEGGVGPQTTQTLRNIERILEAADATWDDVVKVSVYLAEMTEFGIMNEAYGSFFDGQPPARITVGDVGLALDARVEIECVARRRTHGATGHGPPITRRTGFIDHDGEQIYYEVVGEGGIPLVLNHGAGGNHAAWFQQVAPFAADRTVVTWDHRGYGRSTDHGDRSGPEAAVGDLLALLDALKIDRADLVGQSMGGWTIVGLALARPSLVRSLVLADTLGGFTSQSIEAGLAARRTDALVWKEVLGAHPALGEAFSIGQPERAHLYQSLGQMGSADASVILPRLLATTHNESEAAKMTMPVLCLVGDRDPLFPPASIRALANLLPDARVVEISGCGHSPYFEDPAAWNAVVRQFFGTLENPAGR
ncbi:MAG TPA: alpha/beta fold hydrolase [Acidimicrobiales bacterium]|nr:alpha/beta fold hydrolase [Acidimicrobiales bacterium]